MPRKAKIPQLTVAKVKAAGRRLYRERRLTAQHRDRASRDCKYRIGYCRCVIGGALPPSVIKKVQSQMVTNAGDVRNLIRSGVVSAKHTEIVRLKELQMLHDHWANTSREMGARDEMTVRAREAFLEAIKL